MKAKFKTVDEYLSTLPAKSKRMLKDIRNIIKNTVPEAEAVISYNIPGFKLHGAGLIAIAAWKEHVSLYPRTLRMQASIKELSKYEGGKGTIKFPIDRHMPLGLIRRIIKFRLRETLEKLKKKK